MSLARLRRLACRAELSLAVGGDRELCHRRRAVHAFGRRRYARHRRWMLRCYVLICSAVALRLISGAAGLVGVPSPEHAYIFAAWSSWLFPLAACEIRGAPTSRLGRPGSPTLFRDGRLSTRTSSVRALVFQASTHYAAAPTVRPTRTSFGHLDRWIDRKMNGHPDPGSGGRGRSRWIEIDAGELAGTRVGRKMQRLDCAQSRVGSVVERH